MNNLVAWLRSLDADVDDQVRFDECADLLEALMEENTRLRWQQSDSAYQIKLLEAQARDADLLIAQYRAANYRLKDLYQQIKGVK